MLFIKRTVILIQLLVIILSLKAQNQFNDSLFIYIEGSYFFMGSKNGDEDEKPVKKINIDAFYISKYEVTNKQYCNFLNESMPAADTLLKYINLNGSWLRLNCRIYEEKGLYKVEEGYDNLPVNYVSWFGAEAFSEFYGYRLPTEAEWEYAAKGGKNFLNALFKNYNTFSGSDDPETVAWYNKNSEKRIYKVGKKNANRASVFDMSGNVDEWCNDWYLPDYYSITEKENPQGPENADFKVIRGGSWYNSEKMIRITNRRATNPKSQKATIGFRVVKDVDEFCKTNYKQ